MEIAQTKLIPIGELETGLTRQRIVQLVTEQKIRGEKRVVGNLELWYVSQDDVAAHEILMNGLGKAKFGLRYPEPVDALHPLG